MIALRTALPYVVAAAVAAAALYGAYSHGVSTTDAVWQSRWDKHAKALADARSQAEQAERTEEQRRQTAVNEVIKYAQAQINQAQDDAAAARATADSLRDQAKRLASTAGKACSNPGTANAGRAASTTSLVLADLFGRADQAAGELAAAYDRARIAGLACERTYRSLTASGAQ